MRPRVRKRLDPRRALRVGWLAVLALVPVACVGLRTPLPSLTADVVERGRSLGFEPAELARGRELYAARCARCHILPAPDSEPLADWNDILPRMMRKSGLGRDDSARLRAFVLASRAP